VSVVVGSDTLTAETGPDGFYYIYAPNGTYPVAVLVPQGKQPSPPNVGDDASDSDGVPDGFGCSVTTVTVAGSTRVDFGFLTTP
jgi:hypothetical protein